jgi:cbb3-type cytochrome oxidase subunit 3
MKKEIICFFILMFFICFIFFILKYNGSNKFQLESKQNKKDSALLIRTYIYEHSKIPTND